jgi:hypothetical protein
MPPAEDRAERAQPPRVPAPGLDGHVEGLVVGEEPVLRGERLAPGPDPGRRPGAEVADPVGAWTPGGADDGLACVRVVSQRHRDGLIRLIIDEARRQVTAAGHIVTLTATEWKLLTTLASVPGRVFTRYELVNRARGYEYEGYERTIDSHIRNLRRKIDTDSRKPGLIETVTGTGYRLAVTHDRTPAPPPVAVPDQAAAG